MAPHPCGREQWRIFYFPLRVRDVLQVQVSFAFPQRQAFEALFRDEEVHKLFLEPTEKTAQVHRSSTCVSTEILLNTMIKQSISSKAHVWASFELASGTLSTLVSHREPLLSKPFVMGPGSQAMRASRTTALWECSSSPSACAGDCRAQEA